MPRPSWKKTKRLNYAQFQVVAELYLFPQLVARGHYSCSGIARVRFNETGEETGEPAGVEPLGIALEPEADYERRPDDSEAS